ncbi:hypothetical protein HM1_0098 [Heliomicrobium modesticaldum Ice1]|uniref:Uncharacterized protein n=1 Tax=Heliobacterium modesticaldum (strain ATCC 51547 / Ice1) TaxID=498761 RepID=B0TI50_HELMI|nr:hypothetical protein HM1_0098 [Heliomicrobium modesticaldum Ice1]
MGKVTLEGVDAAGVVDPAAKEAAVDEVFPGGVAPVEVGIAGVKPEGEEAVVAPGKRAASAAGGGIDGGALCEGSASASLQAKT